MFLELLHLQVQACVLACKLGLGDRLEPTEQAVRQLLPDTVVLDVALAMAELESEDKNRAVVRLRLLTADNPENEYLMAVLAFTLQATAQEGWKNIYENLLSTSTDSRTRELVHRGLAITGSKSCF